MAIPRKQPFLRASTPGSTLPSLPNLPPSLAENDAFLEWDRGQRLWWDDVRGALGNVWGDTDLRVSRTSASLLSKEEGLYAAITEERELRISGDNALAATIASIVAAAGTTSTVFVQSSEPTANSINDLWLDSDDGFKPYYWSGTDWEDATDERLPDAIAAITAETSARVSAVNSEAATRAADDTTLATSITNVFAALSGAANLWTPNLTNVTDHGAGSFSKTGGSSLSWDAQVYSSECYTGGAEISFYPNQTNKEVMIGIDQSPTDGTDFSHIDYCIFCTDAGLLYAYESGSATLIGDYVSTDRLSVIYDGTHVRYYKNGSLLRGVSAPSDLTFYLDSTFFNTGAQVNQLRFGPANAAAFNAKALVSTEATARASADTALASDITTLTASVGANSTAITNEASARVAADGAIHARWGVNIDVNGRIAGRINLDGTNASSTFLVAVDKFQVANANGTVTAFEIVSGGRIVMGADVQSNNYSAGSAGWRIERNSGNAEFNDVTVRGSIYSSSGTIGGFTLDSTKLSAGSGGSLVELSSAVNAGLKVGGINIYSTATTAPSSGGYFAELPNAILYCPYPYNTGYLELQVASVTGLKLHGSGRVELSGGSARVEIGGNQVLGAQQAAISDIALSGFSYGAEAASIEDKFNAILAAMRAHGFIDT
jgi:hypothetical protein